MSCPGAFACDILGSSIRGGFGDMAPALASGATVTRTFSADAGLLTLGSLVATAQRTASSPTDPNAANDRASRTCTALTSLIVRC